MKIRTNLFDTVTSIWPNNMDKTVSNEYVFFFFPFQNSVLETSLLFSLLLRRRFQSMSPSDFTTGVIDKCIRTSEIVDRLSTVWGGAVEVAFIEIKFVASAKNEPVIVEIGVCLQSGHKDHDKVRTMLYYFMYLHSTGLRGSELSE
jgi:hypothetical protein